MKIKKYLIRYLEDLRIPILMSLLTWWITILIFALLGGRHFFAQFGHNIPIIYYALTILPFTYIIPSLFYQLYKREWLNICFLLLVWISPLALLRISTNFWSSLLFYLGFNL